MKYPNECKCGKPTHGLRLCAACKGEAQKDEGLCRECAEKINKSDVCFDATATVRKTSKLKDLR
jgi:predicted amidophosphoribosyltransferase